MRRDNPPEGVVRANALPQKRQVHLSRHVDAIESRPPLAYFDVDEVVPGRVLYSVDVRFGFSQHPPLGNDLGKVVPLLALLQRLDMGFVFPVQALERLDLGEYLIRWVCERLDVGMVFLVDFLLRRDVYRVTPSGVFVRLDVNPILLVGRDVGRDMSLVVPSDSLGGTNVNKVARPRLADNKILSLDAGVEGNVDYLVNRFQSGLVSHSQCPSTQQQALPSRLAPLLLSLTRYSLPFGFEDR